jgi:archaeal flagellar protein FlaJ
MQKSVQKGKNKEEHGKKVQLTFLDKFSGFSYAVFGGPGTRISKGMPGLRNSILKSNLRITPEALVASALMATMISAAVSIALLVVGIAIGFLYLMLGVVAIPLTFILTLNGPQISASGRSYALENELPYFVGFIQVLASGGVSPIQAMRRVAKMARIFPAAAKEAKLILVDIDVFGMDPISALEKAANYSPNKNFAEFLYGYTTVLKTGGDVATYVHGKMKEIMDATSTKIRRSSETIGTMAEAYVTVTAVLGISLFTLYEIQAVLSHEGGGLTNILLFSFVMVPLLSGVFVWILDGIGTKQPYLDMRPYKALAFSAPAAAVIFLLPLPLQLYLHVSLALIAFTLWPAIVGIRASRHRSGLENHLPDFIRDIAESRKVGLAPEIGIQSLGNKNYGELSPPVRNMGAQLSWGVSLNKVMSTFVNKVDSWVTKVVGVLMMEVVEVGGGTVLSFSEMADFTRKMNDLEADKRSLLKPYTYVIYVAGLLVVMTTFLMVYLLRESATIAPTFSGTASISPGTIELLIVSAIFESWVAGLVAGKMGEGSLASGFRHSLILVLLSLVTVVVASQFIKVPL